MLFYTYPAGVVVVDAVLGRETITPSRLAALLLSTTRRRARAGGRDGRRPAARRSTRSASCSASAPRRAQVVFITISRDGYRSVPADAATLVILGASMVGGALLAVAVGQGDSLVAPLRSLAPWPIVLLAGRRSRPGLSSLLFLTAIRRIGGTRTGILMLFEPVVGVILAGLLLQRVAGAGPAASAAALVLAGRARAPGAVGARSRRRSSRPGPDPSSSPARPVRLPLVARDRVLDVALLVALDPHRPVHDERPHEAHARPSPSPAATRC